jgi:hypothetical protein
LDASAVGATDEVICPVCRSGLVIRLMPAFAQPPETISTASGERALEGEAVCFFHPEKRATVACERCGRFLCALCDVPFGGKHLCPSCLDVTKLPELVNRRVVWGHLAATLGILPLVLFCFYPLYFVTGPAAIFIALWKWKAPGSLVRGPRHGLAILGIIGGCLQLAVVTGIIFAIYSSIRRG